MIDWTHCKAPGQSPPEFIFDDAVGPESVRIGNVGAQEGFGARGAQNDVALETAAQLSPVPLLKRGICSTNIYSIFVFCQKMFPDRKSSNAPRPSRLVAGGEAAPFDRLLCGLHLAKLA